MSIKQKVLIIDDSPLTVKILSNMLKDEYNVISSFSGEQGYEIAVTQRPDIIVLDIVMPEVNGYEVCERLKSNSLTKDIPVIFISALGEMEDERLGLEIGAIDYITKPFSEPIVKIRIKNHLELKRSRDILCELSSIDGLTGIYNRRYFDNVIEQDWKKAIIDKTPLSLLLLDLDHFKIYNDNYGHLEGDECLKLVAHGMKKCVEGKGYTVARFGGEEFVCVMPSTCFDEAKDVAESIMQYLANKKIPFSFSSVSNVITASIGLGTIQPSEAFIMTDFIKEVDDHLYIAKRNGRNQICSARL